MSDAPKRIWAGHDGDNIIVHNGEHDLQGLIATGYLHEYIRADLVAELVQAAEDAEYDLLQWLECAKFLEAVGFNVDDTAPAVERLTAALRAIKETDT